MEIECANKCGNLTDSPDSPFCETCREVTIPDLQSKAKEAMLKFVIKRT